MVALRSTFSAVMAFALVGSASASCNVAGCIGAIEGGGIAVIGACAAAEFTAGLLVPADIACLATITGEAIAAIGACASCTVAGECDPTDQTASQRGCSQLGPNHCMQQSSSVPHPSKTDHKVGDYSFHCHNRGLVVDKGGNTCTYPCANCTQCAGVPTNAKRQLEEVFVA